jgi:hypothetical protein
MIGIKGGSLAKIIKIGYCIFSEPEALAGEKI